MPLSSAANLEKKSVHGVFPGLGRLAGRVAGPSLFPLNPSILLALLNLLVVPFRVVTGSVERVAETTG